MAEIKVYYDDDTVELFQETSRAGGSYCTSGKADNGFYIITEAWGNQIVIPQSRIKKIEVKPSRY